ncbi:MAG: hypothetical protein R3284_11960, partial [Rubricoccaceae bacterium]|nr:hypothetical protein [Rubricoccaceae bacterium]
SNNEGSGIWLRLDPDRRAADGSNLLFNNVIAGNATTHSEEAREMSVEGTSLNHVRTNRFGGNLYGRRSINDLRSSTFFVVPNPEHVAGFRSGDLEGWIELTGERSPRLIAYDPTMRGAERAIAEELPGDMRASIEAFLKGNMRTYAYAGAEPSVVRRGAN